MEYNFREVESKWRQRWAADGLYHTDTDPSKPKYYVLDMFPYPSGAGLHVGHPLGYIASDIVARYRQLKGYNVLHPMGFDAFGLPAEQYAIETGQHPAVTTAQNIATFKEQLGKIGFSYDWNREVRTSDPAYYRWTQWMFLRMFGSWYNQETDRAEPIDTLERYLAERGNEGLRAACDEDTPTVSADDWQSMDARGRSDLLLRYRLAYLADAVVNWCPALGMVLANDEVKDGVSERGGHPVEQKKMRQWMLRITAYAERLLGGLDEIDWTDALKEQQRNWIGRSHGAELRFPVVIDGATQPEHITVFTTRPDTSFGVTFMVMAPEHELVDALATRAADADTLAALRDYVAASGKRSERERMADVKTVSGAFTGFHARNPFNDEIIPVYVADYVLAGYGTGAVMAVPSSDDRDYRFARHFGLPVRCVIEGTEDLPDPTEVKQGKIINSGFLNGLPWEEAVKKSVAFAEEKGFGRARINYRLRDAVFSRQRYWGEPVPIYFRDGIPHPLRDDELPLTLPEVDRYLPTETGDPPLRRAEGWRYGGEHPYELSTMPGYAGSSWYFLRYTDPQNETAFADRAALDYWGQVDLYVGGTEHATGHLLYARFWHKFLFDRGLVGHREPFGKLVNQGMIQGVSAVLYKDKHAAVFASAGRKDELTEPVALHADIRMVDGQDALDVAAFRQWRPEYADATFLEEDGKFYCERPVEKMSKRWYNVVNPDDVVARYGADTLRLYEMFLGPLEQAKPWDTQGIDGVAKFIRKLWRLFHDGNRWVVTDADPTADELRTLHRTLKKTEEDIGRYAFNTVVSAFMIAVNELTSQKCRKRAVLEPLLVALAPFAPFVTEELWAWLGHADSIHRATFPQWEERYLTEDTFTYPVMVNGKLRDKLALPATAAPPQLEAAALASENVQKYLGDKPPRRVVIVPKKIINIVV